jgi:hypothetical protein
MRQDGRPGKAFSRARAEADTFVWAADTYERELQACRRAYETAGRLDALGQAVIVCHELARPLPPWLVRDLVEALSSRVTYRKQDLVDFIRYDAVDDAREHRLTLERAFEFASLLLEPTDARGSPDAMKKSYYTVRRRMRREPGRYFRTPAMTRSLRQYHAPDPHVTRVIAQFPEGHPGPDS